MRVLVASLTAQLALSVSHIDCVCMCLWLVQILLPMMLRRLKEDVEKSLAPKEETIVEVCCLTVLSDHLTQRTSMLQRYSLPTIHCTNDGCVCVCANVHVHHMWCHVVACSEASLQGI